MGGSIIQILLIDVVAIIRRNLDLLKLRVRVFLTCVVFRASATTMGSHKGLRTSPDLLEVAEISVVSTVGLRAREVALKSKHLTRS